MDSSKNYRILAFICVFVAALILGFSMANFFRLTSDNNANEVQNEAVME